MFAPGTAEKRHTIMCRDTSCLPSVGRSTPRAPKLPGMSRVFRVQVSARDQRSLQHGDGLISSPQSMVFDRLHATNLNSRTSKKSGSKRKRRPSSQEHLLGKTYFYPALSGASFGIISTENIQIRLSIPHLERSLRPLAGTDLSARLEQPMA